MNISDFSKEQFELICFSNSKINIAHGPVRSGKNFAENIRIYKYLIQEPKDNIFSPIVFAGVSQNAVYRNILQDLFKLIGKNNYSYKENKGKGTVFGRDFYVFGFKDCDDFKALRGSTLGGALLTEGTLCHRNFFDELMARLSISGSKCFIDTNPDSPYHWLYQEFIINHDLKEQNILKEFPFNFDSNLSLDLEYKNSLKALYKEGSLLYKRMIEGKWVLAEGIIYDNFDDSKNTIDKNKLPKTYENLFIGIDYGTNNPCVFLLIGQKNDTYYVISEYYYDSSKELKQKTDEEYAKDLLGFIEKLEIKKIFIDPSASSFIAELKNYPKLKRLIEKANNSVLSGIKKVSVLFNQKKIIISKSCVNLLKEIASYCWDTSAQAKGEDKPIKKWDHAPDALRYCLYTLESKPVSGDLSNVHIISKHKNYNGLV